MENGSIIINEEISPCQLKTRIFIPAINIETNEVNGEELLQQIEIKPDLILPYIHDFLDSQDKIQIFSDFIPQIVEYLVNYSQIDDEISYISKSILSKIFRFNFQNPSPLQIQLANYFFSLSHNPSTLHEFINLTYALVDHSIMFKDFLFAHEGIDIISSLPFSTFQDDMQLDFLNLVSLLIRHDAPVTDEQYFTLIQIFLSIMCLSEEPEYVDITGKTFYYISKFKPQCLIQTNIFNFISESMDKMTEKGICFVLVGLSICFTKENQDFVSYFDEKFNPDFFHSFLRSDFENIVIDGTVAVINIMKYKPEFIDQFVERGIIELLLNNLHRSFDCKRVSIRAIFLYLEKVSVDEMKQFLTEEFIELLNELMETDDRETLSIIADYVQLFQIHGLDDEPYIGELVDIFLCDHADNVDDDLDFV